MTRAEEDGGSRQVDGIAKAMGGSQVKKNMVLVVGATGTLGRQVIFLIVRVLHLNQHPNSQSRTCSCAPCIC